MKRRVIFLICLAILGVASSGFESTLSAYNRESDTTIFKVPANFPKPVYDFKGNRVTDAGFRLGRMLFYDPLLSRDKSISCANCHQSFAAFAQLDHAVSHGVDECLGTRNTPALFNLAWQREFMWDGGIHHIELSPITAMTNECEMASNLQEIVARLNASEKYPALFRQAFHRDEINSQSVFRALAQFTSMLVSANSKYDQYIRHENNVVFTADEEAGYAIFKAKCSACHSEPLFTDRTYRSNGLDKNPDDIGRDSITHQANDVGKFRVPSLRNVEVSGPYMHDGRFNSLKEVLDHYNTGVVSSPNLDPLLKKNGVLGIRLDNTEQLRLIAFLKTLTDTKFINDKRFQDPNKIKSK